MKNPNFIVMLSISIICISTLHSTNHFSLSSSVSALHSNRSHPAIADQEINHLRAVLPIAGNAFQTAGLQRERITNRGISSWRETDTEFSVYINSPESGSIALSINLSEQESNSSILVSTGNTSRRINIKSTDSGTIAIGTFPLKAGYNQLILKGIRKDGEHYARPGELILEGKIASKLNFIRDNQNARFHFGRRGPSVHLGYQLPADKQFKWFYNEMTVPEGEDPIGSYFMANGFGEGYFGIQVNSPTERRILFSVWSPFHTDNPNEIPDDQKIIILNKGAQVNTGEFGNEGSGGQSFLRYNWKAGVTYRFLNSIEPDGKGNTIYTAYFFDPVTGEWQLIASFLRPKTDTWYKRPHSFLENFSPDNGHLARRVFFNNQWARDVDGNWVELTRARFTGDDIARVEYRLDRDGGLDGNRFYLQNGGFINYTSVLNSMHERPASGIQPAIDPETIARTWSKAKKKALSIDDFAGWQRIEQRLISNDGKKVIFETKAQKGDGILVIYNAQTGIYDTIPHAHSAQIAAGSGYAIFKLRLPDDSLRTLKLAKTKKEDMPREAIGIFTFANRNMQRIDSVKSYRLPAEGSNWLTYLQEQPKEGKKTTHRLVVFNPLNGEQLSFAQADTFAIANKGTTVALLTAVDTFKMRSLICIYPREKQADTLLIHTADLRRITLDQAGRQLSWLASNDTSSVKNYGLYFTQLDPSRPIIRKADSLGRLKTQPDSIEAPPSWMATNIRLIADTLHPSLPAGWAPSINGNLFFSDDNSKLFFGTSALAKPEPNDTLLSEEKARFDLWSHTDNVIKPRQLKQEASKKKQSHLAVYRITDNKVLQLADTIVESIQLMHKNDGELAIGTDRKPHERSITWSARSLSDYYLIDLRTGIRTTLLKGGQHLQLSPGGQFAAWFDPDQAQFYTHDLQTGITLPVSISLPVSLTNELHDTPSDPRPYGIAGWTEGDRHILLYDRYDLWQLDPRGQSSPVNLTNGRASNLRYRYISTDIENPFIPLNEPVLLSITNEDSYEEGYAALTISKTSKSNTSATSVGRFISNSFNGLGVPAVRQSPNTATSSGRTSPITSELITLIYGPYTTGGITKAKNSDELLWSRQTASRFPEVEYSNLQFSTTTVLSATNSQQTEYNWPTVELVEWISFAGDSLRGLLYKPQQFDPNKKYPMVVYFYEKSADTYYRYHYPQPSRSIISIPFYVSNDYIVFVPDIAYTTGYPGKNAYDAIVSGVSSLTSTRSYINEKAMGLQGQSWGGYQIAYLITQTDIFAAAMAGAPVSNMISAYGGIRWGTGMSRMFQYEETQSRIGGSLWERPLLYIENSPIFHAPRVNTPLLMMHNDNDGAVPWYQGIEYFMALYRLGKPVWMINYNGMEHNIEAQYWANRVDLSTRMFEFFNHYLKGEKKPGWML